MTNGICHLLFVENIRKWYKVTYSFYRSISGFKLLYTLTNNVGKIFPQVDHLIFYVKPKFNFLCIKY